MDLATTAGDALRSCFLNRRAERCAGGAFLRNWAIYGACAFNRPLHDCNQIGKRVRP